MRFLPRQSAFALVALFSIATLASCGNDETRDVQIVYDAYMAALSARDGQKAVVLVDQNTLSYYEEMKRGCLNDGPAEIARRAFVDRLTIGTIRASADLNYIKLLTAEQLFSYAVSEGLAGDDEPRDSMSIAEIQVNGDSARVSMKLNGKPSPIAFEFNREDGIWKIDLTSAFPVINRGLTEMVRSQNMTEDAFIFEALSAMTEREISETIWNKPSLK